MTKARAAYSLPFGLRCLVEDTIEKCTRLLDPYMRGDWHIFFCGPSRPSDQVKVNIQFARKEDRERAYELVKNAGPAIKLDTHDRRSPMFELRGYEYRSGVDRRLINRIRVERPDTGRRAHSGEIEDPPDTNTKKVLIVDDDAQFRAFLSIHFENWGYDVLTAENGDDGINMARKEQPSLVVMDMNMPGKTGFEAVKLLREDPKTKFLTILAITGHDTAVDRDEAYGAGCNAFVAKPIEASQLFESVNKVLG